MIVESVDEGRRLIEGSLLGRLEDLVVREGKVVQGRVVPRRVMQVTQVDKEGRSQR
jgi:hypothetical protein